MSSGCAEHRFQCARGTLRFFRSLPQFLSRSPSSVASSIPRLRFSQSEVIRQDSSIQPGHGSMGRRAGSSPRPGACSCSRRFDPNPTVGRASERIQVGEQFRIRSRLSRRRMELRQQGGLRHEAVAVLPTTAVVLLATRDDRDHSVVTRSLEQLQKDVASERSVVAVALPIICLRAYGVAQIARTGCRRAVGSADPGNLLGTAMMLYALTEASRQVAFTV